MTVDTVLKSSDDAARDVGNVDVIAHRALVSE